MAGAGGYIRWAAAPHAGAHVSFLQREGDAVSGLGAAGHAGPPVGGVPVEARAAELAVDAHRYNIAEAGAGLRIAGAMVVARARQTLAALLRVAIEAVGTELAPAPRRVVLARVAGTHPVLLAGSMLVATAVQSALGPGKTQIAAALVWRNARAMAAGWRADWVARKPIANKARVACAPHHTQARSTGGIGVAAVLALDADGAVGALDPAVALAHAKAAVVVDGVPAGAMHTAQ
jgi:hypothetical protein